MPRRDVVRGQFVTEEKKIVANRLRRDMTAAETALWELLRRNALGVRFRRQQIVDGFVADFYCHAAGLVLEVDGGSHDGQEEADQGREEVFRGRSLHTLRFTNAQVLSESSTVLNTISQFLARTTNRDSPRPLLGEGGARQRGEGVARPRIQARSSQRTSL